jgi:hypothetical protein
MKRPKLQVHEYRHSKTHPYYLDLRAFGQGRKFFKTKAEAEAERLRQITTLARHGREALGLPPAELSSIVQARKKLAKHGKTIDDAATRPCTLRTSKSVSRVSALTLGSAQLPGSPLRN